MKTERRHDLETNELAVRLTDWIERLKPHTGSLVGGLIVLCGIAVVSSFWATQSAAKHQAAWDEFAIAHNTTDPELASLRRVADKQEYAGTPMRDWAMVTWADRQVLLASSDYLINRSSADDRLREVVGVYEGLISGVADEVVQNRSRFGLARVYELQNKLEEARQQYSSVKGDLAPMATHRAGQLDSSDVQETCTWLATVELPRRSLGGGAGGSGTRPDFNASLPETSAPEGSPGADLPETRTLEDILSAVSGDSESEPRYPTDDAEESEAAPQDNPSEDEDVTESESDESAEADDDAQMETEAEAEPAEEAEADADAAE